MSRLNVKNIIEGYTLDYSNAGLPPKRTGERKRIEFWTSKKMSKRELFEEAASEHFDITTINVSSARVQYD